MNKIKLMINDKEIISEAGKTIIEVINEHKLDKIPTLCHDKRIEPYGSCFLCVVEVKGMNRLVPSCSTPASNGMVIYTNNENIRNTRKAALELLLSNHYADCIGPCTIDCPAGVNAQAYIALVSMGRYDEALRLVKQNNPMPLSIGRVCIRNCEDACRRNFIDEAVAINSIKRYVADFDLEHQWKPKLKPKQNKKVAIIGGGPAGLTCSYYLSLEGISSTIFEKLPKLGGMLRYGIPDYRLPKDILDAEINWITGLGIEVKTGITLGKDFYIENLLNDGYDAAFIAVGAHKASSMSLDKENETKGVLKGIDFLREVKINGAPELKGTVAVVGGGNTAIDAARTALRCNANKVMIIYRRSIKEMPAHHEEIEAAQKEGIEIHILTNPIAILETEGKIKGIECIKMELVQVVPGERPKPFPMEGSEFIMNCDYLIAAIGQQVDTSFLNGHDGLKMDKWGTVIADKNTLETSIQGVFAGGDVVNGPLTAISAIAHGKKAALSIISYLKNGKVIPANGKFLSFKHKLGEIGSFEYENVKMIKRERIKELSVNQRINNFNEVELGLEEKQTLDETNRCLECGCAEYHDCSLRKYADDFNIDISRYIGETRKYKVDARHPLILLDSNKCINCGKCVRTCSEILKVSALGFVYRGFNAIVKPAMEKALSETNCVACGNCIDVCPTGAITEKFPFKSIGTLKKENHEAICNFCSLGCKLNLKLASSEIIYVANDTEEIKDSVNRGYLCSKGRFGHRYLLDNKRLKSPIIRKNGKSTEVSWSKAIDLITNKIKEIAAKYGPDSVAVFGSPALSNESLYLLQKLSRVGIATNNVSSFTQIEKDTQHDSLDEILGMTISTATFNDFDCADLIVSINSNLSDENLVMELRIKAAQKKGARLLVMNSSELKITKFADLWVDSKKGTNTLLLHSIMQRLIEERMVDENIISNSIKGFKEFRDMVSVYGIDEICQITGIENETYKQIWNYFKNSASRIIFVYNMDSLKERSSNDLKAIGNFLLLTNRINKEGNGLILLHEHNNTAGSMQMGLHPSYLPGFVGINDKEQINKISREWNTDLQKVFKPVDIKDKLLKKEIKALLIFGEDPLLNMDYVKFLEEMEFILVSDLFETSTTEIANVVLPLATFIEESGTYTSCERRVQRSLPIRKPSNGKENWKIIFEILKKLNKNFNYSSDLDIFSEIRKINRLYRNCEIGETWNIQPVDDSKDIIYKNKGFATYDINIASVNEGNMILLSTENYYKEKIKNRIST